jgi:hypothetical protein
MLLIQLFSRVHFLQQHYLVSHHTTLVLPSIFYHFKPAMASRSTRNSNKCFQGLDGILFAIFHPVQAKHERLASAHECQNTVQCATHNALPPKLTLQIASTLSNEDFLSLRFSCRWFTK